MEYLKIGDISAAYDFDRQLMIDLSEVTIDIDIFDFVEVENPERSSQSSPSHNVFHTEENHGEPHAKIKSLPNRCFNGLWDL